MSFRNDARALVTGSSGLIGSEVVDYFCRLGWDVYGVDNNMRADFFGPGGDTRWNQQRLLEAHKGFRHHELDIRDRVGLDALVGTLKPSLVVHTAAQPSHGLAGVLSAKKMPYEYVEQNREGDHICYYSDLRKMTAHHAEWGVTKLLDDVIREIHAAMSARRTA